jgi:hypothetical protein
MTHSIDAALAVYEGTAFADLTDDAKDALRRKMAEAVAAIAADAGTQTEARALWLAATREDICNDGDAISVIATALAAKDAELAEAWQRYVDANEARIDAEAQLAEASKALEPFAAVAEHDIGDDETDDDIFWPISNARYSMSGRLRVGHLRAARRAREGGRDA